MHTDHDHGMSATSERDEGTSAASTSGTIWEEHYATTDAGWAAHPNAVVERLVPEAPEGARATALDVGCGHGADALLLARRGWRVTALDVSATAVRRTMERAREAGLADRITGVTADLTRTTPEGPFGLVTASYFHPPTGIPREPALRAAAALVAEGGLLLVVDHASVAPWSWDQGRTAFPTPRETLEGLDLPGRWTPVEVETATRMATGPSGQTAEVVDSVILVRREPADQAAASSR
jgi:SAM-dependent methyltransferase